MLQVQSFEKSNRVKGKNVRQIRSGKGLKILILKEVLLTEMCYKLTVF